MPLLELSGMEAVATRKENVFSTWGNRTQPNRVEPIARPDFSLPFTIEPGEKIFTVGSCFARNVENELLRRGFVLPMRDLFCHPEFSGLGRGVVNNFGTPSIYNEFAWALGEKEFVPEQHIVEVQPGKFIDLHVVSSVRPAEKDVVEARRRAITEAYRAVLDCRVVIMTLGLVEVWYDSSTGCYLNGAPLPGMLKKEPERFSLHVLSYEETRDFLEKTLQLLRSKGRKDLQIILTVSPVPLTVTHRAQDVMVANCYSKSVLRTVAETMVMTHDFVTYYPSYESVTLSDRRTAWADDFTHVTEEIVTVNVGRMVDACIASSLIMDVAAIRQEIEHGGIAVAVSKAQAFRMGSQELARTFFEAFKDCAMQSADFALEEAQFWADQRLYQQALDCLTLAPAGLENEKSVQLAAECLQKLNRPAEACELIDKALAGGAKSNFLWKSLFIAAGKTGDEALVLSVLGRWTKAAWRHAGYANTLAGRWFHERGDYARALDYFTIAHNLDAADTISYIYHVETLLALGRRDEAAQVFGVISPVTPRETILHERLANALGAKNL